MELDEAVENVYRHFGYPLRESSVLSTPISSVSAQATAMTAIRSAQAHNARSGCRLW